MRSLLKLVHDESMGGAPVSLRSVAQRYGAGSFMALIAAHDQALNVRPGPFSFSAPILTGGLAALGGSVSVTIQPDGSVRWQGKARNTGIDGYDFAISAIVRSPAGRAIALAHSDHVPGHVPLVGDPSERSWDESRPPNRLIMRRSADFANAQLETHLEYSSDIGSVLEDAISWLIKFGIGSVLGAPLGVVLFVGLEIGSLISTGSLVPGARMAEGILWMAGPANTMFAIAAEGIASLGSRIRELRQEEYDWANRKVFDGALPPRDKILLTDTTGGGNNRGFVFPRFDGMITLNLGPVAFDDPLKYKAGITRDRYPDKPVQEGEIFIHELVHACQIHNSTDLGYLADAFSSKLCEATGDSPYVYGPAGSDYSSFSLEQQAQIVSDWFAGARPVADGRYTSNQTGTPEDINSPYFRYINENVRLGRF